MYRTRRRNSLAAAIEDAAEEHLLEEPTRPYLGRMVSILQRAQRLIMDQQGRDLNRAMQIVNDVRNSIVHNISYGVWPISAADPNLNSKILARLELRSALPLLTTAIAHLQNQARYSANQRLHDAIRRLRTAAVHMG